ncbi:SDR family NAD(P)-dependent oxidoreductase [Agrococcus sp. Marseille-P2731]|uniref:SDR family NAD(P)-dependent oxidoreductase n=1 Tax=Agrococcus sp. Marseille-P2731 TaxID=1841862 RepID=UPI00093073FE|nr:SDR family NAD(P)-dependent oxidoreductase [Agrococcus sp. Marseille-P2731]
MGRLADRSVVVFGGGSKGARLNNGLATSIVYAREAAALTIVDRDADAVADATARVRELQPSAEVLGVVGDVTDPESVAAAVQEAEAFGGGIDVLHNNVGIARMGGPMEMTLEEWDLVHRVNLTSVFLTCKHVLPGMLGRGRGAIVNVASVGGMRYIGYNYPSYSATKGALVQFTQNLALEYAAQGIRANCVSPGYIETPMIHEQISGSYASVEEMLAARNALSPTKRMGEPFDVAHAALFLASDEAKYVNGVNLPVDGGLVQQAAAPVAH